MENYLLSVTIKHVIIRPSLKKSRIATFLPSLQCHLTAGGEGTTHRDARAKRYAQTNVTFANLPLNSFIQLPCTAHGSIVHRIHILRVVSTVYVIW